MTELSPGAVVHFTEQARRKFDVGGAVKTWRKGRIVRMEGSIAVLIWEGTQNEVLYHKSHLVPVEDKCRHAAV